MLRKVSVDQTSEELQSCYRPTIIDSNYLALPFNNLGDREFELLCYSLVKEELNKGLYSEISQINDIALMHGVGERGRDCVLYYDNEVRGVIQCKKYSGRLTKPQILKELIKFALHAVKDSTILTNENNFKYIFYVSNDFNGKAIDLIHNYKEIISEEIESKEVEKYTNEVLSEYESFRIEKINPPIEKLYKLLKSIDVSGVNATDLTNRVLDHSKILNSFFNIRTVVNLEDNDKQIRNAMMDFGLKLLTDSDLKSLQARIGHIDPSQRIRLGLVDFYGYSFDFFNSIGVQEYEKLLKMVNEINIFMNTKEMDYAVKIMKKLINAEIISVLLNSGKIHQFSTQICIPYLMYKVMPNVVKIPNANLLNRSFEFSSKTDEIIDNITKQILSTSRSIFDGDYSILDGDRDLIEDKKKFFDCYHQGFKDINEAEAQLKKDIPVLLPALDKIVKDLNNLYKNDKTIIISDLTFMNDPEKLKSMADTFKKLDS